MQNYSQSDDQRQHVRYLPKKDIFIDINRDFIEGIYSVSDLSKGGLGFYATKTAKELVGKSILIDLVSGKNSYIIRSLLSLIVFSQKVTQANKNTNFTARYGLKFVNPSNLQKRLLARIINKYLLSDDKQTP